MSALDQPAFSRRIAISGDMPAAPFSTRDSVWRATPKCSAAAVTLSPNGFRHVFLIVIPGWRGFFMGIVGLVPSLVVVH